MEYSPEKIKASLTPDQIKLYQLIWNKFVASQMRPAEYSVNTVDITAGRYGLRSVSTELVFKGYLTVYDDLKTKRMITRENTGKLPSLKKDENLNLKKLIPDQHFTKPPAVYTEASLVKELETQGIGRPSTYAQIINTIQVRKYVTKTSGKLVSTELGRNVKDILVKGFPDIFDVDFTAGMKRNWIGSRPVKVSGQMW